MSETMKELVERVRKAPGATLHLRIAAIVSVLEQEELRMAASYGLLEADRRTYKTTTTTQRAVPGMPARTDYRSWRKIEFQKWAVWTGKAARTHRLANRMFEQIVAAFNSGNETYAAVQKRLPETTRAAFERWIKAPRLA